MEKLDVIVRPNKEGLWAEILDLPGCFSFGSSFEELDSMLREAIALHIEGVEDKGGSYPDFLNGEFEFNFKIDLHDFFEAYPVSIKGLAERAGINRSLLNQYAKGSRLLTPKQAYRIKNAVNQIGRELMALSF